MKKYRNEWKYVLPQASLEALNSRLSAILGIDKNAGEDGIYSIHSLYLDNVYDSCAKENDSGIGKRHKYRIRYYGDNKDFIRLECKEKYNGRCHKESCILTEEEYEDIVNSRFENHLYREDKPVLKKLATESMCRYYTPRAIIDYERVAYVEPISNVRITLDRNITVSESVDGFREGDYVAIPLQPVNQHVLEVKFDEILPGYIRRVIDEYDLVQTSFSKYYLGRQQLQRMGRKY